MESNPPILIPNPLPEENNLDPQPDLQPARPGWIAQSRMFELARSGRRLTHILAVIPLSVIFMVIAELGSLPILIYLAMTGGLGTASISTEHLPPTLAGLVMGLFLISAFFLVYVFVGLWVRYFEGRPFRTLGYEARSALVRYAGGFAAGVLMFLGAAFLLWALGALVPEQGDPSRQGLAALAGVLIVLPGWIVQGGAEEVVMRGWVLPVLGARYRPWVGIAVSSLMFAVMHGLNNSINLLALFNLALFGVFTALYVLREGSLWGVSALHSAWNWVQGNVLGFDVSGLDAGGITLWNFTHTGPDWITGGGFGPEGGIAVTVMLLIGIAVVILWKR